MVHFSSFLLILTPQKIYTIFYKSIQSKLFCIISKDTKLWNMMIFQIVKKRGIFSVLRLQYLDSNYVNCRIMEFWDYKWIRIIIEMSSSKLLLPQKLNRTCKINSSNIYIMKYAFEKLYYKNSFYQSFSIINALKVRKEYFTFSYLWN